MADPKWRLHYERIGRDEVLPRALQDVVVCTLCDRIIWADASDFYKRYYKQCPKCGDQCVEIVPHAAVMDLEATEMTGHG